MNNQNKKLHTSHFNSYWRMHSPIVVLVSGIVPVLWFVMLVVIWVLMLERQASHSLTIGTP